MLKKYIKYKNKYLNLKNQFGGNYPYNIKDVDLKYYHTQYPSINSSITIYGEKHDLDYQNFLSEYIDTLYSTDRKQILIIEKNGLELYKNNKKITFMEKHNNPEINKIRKKIVIDKFFTPIDYFSYVYKNNGSIPNTEIICGDIRIKDIFKLIIKINNVTSSKPNYIINKNFLKKFKRTWKKQLSVLTSDEYSEIKLIINRLLSTISSNMTNKEVEKKSNLLNVQWINLSNISMLQHVITNISDNVDITIFVGEIHMDHFIEEIEKIYPPVIYNETLENNDVFNEYYIPSPKSSNKNDNFDTDPKFNEYWFKNKIRLTGYEIKPNIYYSIRFKNQVSSFVNYKFLSREDNKIVLEQANCMSDEKIIKLDIDNIYAYKLRDV